MRKRIKLNPALERSKFRSRFRLDKNDLGYINRIGLEKIESHARDLIKQRLAPAEPKNDGKQTPFRGHPVFKAQHATATCCRGCLEKWYNIPRGRALTEDEIDTVIAMIMVWVGTRIPPRKP